MADRQNGTTAKPASSRETDDAVLEEIRKAILSVRFGNVQVIVQDGKVVQIDKTEKIRLT
jgi:hypothetical protein